MKNEVIMNSCWLDKDTFMVEFVPHVTKEDFDIDGVSELVVVEYHRDEKKWIVDKQYYDCYCDFIENEIITDSVKGGGYLHLAQIEFIKSIIGNNSNNGNGLSYSDMIDIIETYYVSNELSRRDEVGKIIKCQIIELMNILNERFGKC